MFKIETNSSYKYLTSLSLKQSNQTNLPYVKQYLLVELVNLWASI